MKAFLPILIFISSLPAAASDLPKWVNAEAARIYAEAALIEWSAVNCPQFDRDWLNSEPLILARSGSGGEKVVQVVYAAGDSSYVVTMVVGSDGFLRVFGRLKTIDMPEAIANRFYDPAFDPASLLDMG